MADIKISELTAVSSLNNGDLVEVSQVNALAPSGYTSLKASMADLGKKVNSDIEYTTDLADFTDKTTLGAIKETAKDKNVADEYDDTQTYDKGDVVIYKNTLYICTTNNTTGTWDVSKWTATTIDNIVGDLTTLTTTDKSSLVGAVNELNAVNGGTVTASTGFTITSQRLVKQGKSVFLYLVMRADTAFSQARITVGNVPAGFRPQANANLVMACSGQDNGFSNRLLTGLITSGGDIMVGDLLLPAGEKVKEIRITTSYEQYW